MFVMMTLALTARFAVNFAKGFGLVSLLVFMTLMVVGLEMSFHAGTTLSLKTMVEVCTITALLGVPAGWFVACYPIEVPQAKILNTPN